ncbi:MAG TPA: maleylpyruvate isomerase family mycothiol-dependent enzyme [Acidimicrobiales bacterium]|nr:maleylpyruvate isomerase family mycothiol-dependent enzyme [Acidimicrobiales bacterium]
MNPPGAAGAFGFDDAIDAIGAESRRLSDAVAAADLDARVPTTPKWSVRDLAHHIGTLQWSWSENVRAKNPAQRSEGSLSTLPHDNDLVAWLGWCTYSLLGALRDAGPESPCWAWWGDSTPHTAGAVARHQAQEVAVHRWDAERAVGSPGPLPPELATDGVPEFIEVMLGSDIAALRGAVALHASDTERIWTVGADSSVAGAAPTRTAELTATASDLVLMLYRRLPVPDADVDGDPMLVASLLALADTS